MTPTIDFNIAFDLDGKEFILSDATDYAGENIVPANVKGAITATGPSGVFHTGNFVTPDVDPNSSLDSAAISLPLDSENLVEQGSYTFNYRIKVTGQQFNLQIVDIQYGRVYVNGDFQNIIENYTAATLSDENLLGIDGTIILSDTLYSPATGLTSFVIIDASSDPVVGNVVGVTSTYEESYAKGFTFTFEYPEADIEVVSDCDCSIMTITDATSLNLTVNGSIESQSRSFVAKYPQGINPQPADETSSLQEFSINPIWTGTWIIRLTNYIVYQYNSYLTVAYQLTGVCEHKVSCESSLCEAFECMSNVYSKYTQMLTYNSKESGILQMKLVKMTSAYMNYNVARKCGEDASTYLADIVEIAESCGCGCGCSDSTSTGPQEVVSLCQNAIVSAEGTFIFQSANNGIGISENVVGTTHTYTFSLDQTILGQLILDKITNEITIADISDVNTDGIAANYILKWTGSEWAVVKFSLANLTDVDTTSVAPAASHTLFWNTGSQKWSNRKALLSDLGDVNLADLADGVMLVYDGGTSRWICIEIPSNTLNGLADVTITGPLVDQAVLIWDPGTLNWINKDNTAWTALPTGDFAPNYANFGNPYNVLQYKYNYGRKSISIRGAFENTSISPAVDTLIYTIADPDLRPLKTVSLMALDTNIPSWLMLKLNAAGEITVLGGHSGGAAMDIPEQEISLT